MHQFVSLPSQNNMKIMCCLYQDVHSWRCCIQFNYWFTFLSFATFHVAFLIKFRLVCYLYFVFFCLTILLQFEPSELFTEKKKEKNSWASLCYLGLYVTKIRHLNIEPHISTTLVQYWYSWYRGWLILSIPVPSLNWAPVCYSMPGMEQYG